MPAKFMVLRDDGMPVIRECVRIAKKSLVFSRPVDGKNQVAKERCFYYNEAEDKEAFDNLKSLVKKIKHLEKRRKRYLDDTFKQVQVKTTHF